MLRALKVVVLSCSLLTGTSAQLNDEEALLQQQLALSSQDASQQVGKCEDIKELARCQRSKQLYGFTCAGWGGSWCVPPQGGKCSDLTLPGICKRAKERLGMNCGRWVDDECQDQEDEDFE
mmetsp:Transcript_88901/g.206887  ORF Transcript_88901/g.206887 Transcript_88901/m.206887 type:complete len:121 (+) Transcript_88901:103-465(+)